MLAKLSYRFWFVAIISIIVIFFNLGGIPLLDPDEPVYAETPKEMFVFDEFVSPRIFGEYWYDKPPMYYWLVAGSYKILGISEFSSRFPSALLAIACALFIYWSGRRLFNERVGMISALVLTTSIEFFYLGKAAVTDMTLLFCFTVSLLSFIEKRYYMAYAFAGLATLTKGPIGLLLPGAIVFSYILVTRNWSYLKTMKIPSGLLLYSVIALPWYVVMYQLHGSAFIDTFLGFHNITRFTSPEHPEGILWYYYIPVLILGFFPWTSIMLQSIWTSLTKSKDDFPILVFLNIWTIVIFVFFSISQTKLVSYILPMYPSLALVVGWYIDRLWTTSHEKTSYSWAISLIILAALFIVGMFFGLKDMPELASGVYVSAAIFSLMSIVVTYFVWTRAIGRAFWTQILGMLLFSMVLVGILFPLAAPKFTTKTMAKEFMQKYDGTSPVYIIKFLRPGFTFYTDVYGKELKTNQDVANAIQNSQRAYFVLRQSEYNRLPDMQRQMITVLKIVDDKVLLLKE